MKPIAPMVLILAVMAGCTTMTPEERRAVDSATCRDYGFRVGTDAFAECIQRIDLDRRAQQRANMAALDRPRPPVIIYREVVVPPRP